MIDHTPGEHDDLANVIAGVGAMLTAKSNYNFAALAGTDDHDEDPDGARAFRYQRLMEHIMRYG